MIATFEDKHVYERLDVLDTGLDRCRIVPVIFEYEKFLFIFLHEVLSHDVSLKFGCHVVIKNNIRISISNSIKTL